MPLTRTVVLIREFNLAVFTYTMASALGVQWRRQSSAATESGRLGCRTGARRDRSRSSSPFCRRLVDLKWLAVR